MASVTNAEIRVAKTAIQAVDLRSMPTEGRSENPEAITLKQYHPSFLSITGQSPTHSLILSSAGSSHNPFFHNACVYLPGHDELYLTSNLLQSTSTSQLPIILISKVNFKRSAGESGAVITSAEWMKLRPPPNMQMPAGACVYDKGIVFCSQGTLTSNTGGLFYMPRNNPPMPIITSFGGRPFNSPQQPVMARDGNLWFTDSCAGFEADIRPPPGLPNQVYRYDIVTGSLRVMADGLGRPTGLCLSTDEETLYVTDTDAIRTNEQQDTTRAATIYAWDVGIRSGQPFLANKRLFAFAMHGVPQTVRCDEAGNVYAACGDGVEVWNSGGEYLGLVGVPGGCSSIGFGKQGEMFICAEERLWRLQFGDFTA